MRMTRSQASSGCTSAGARSMMPALLTRISSLDCQPWAASMAVHRAALSPTSQAMGRKRLPSASISAPDSARFSIVREMPTTSAPASASPRAMVRPNPKLAPVTRATLPSRRNRSSMFVIRCRPHRCRSTGPAPRRRLRTVSPSPPGRRPAAPGPPRSGRNGCCSGGRKEGGRCSLPT